VTSSLGTAELVDRIWSRDPTVWTGGDEAQWLGWLDEPLRMRERVDELLAFASEVRPQRVCLLGMGGSSLAPEVMRRLFRVSYFTVLDTTHPSAIRRVTSASAVRTVHASGTPGPDLASGSRRWSQVQSPSNPASSAASAAARMSR